MNERFRRAVRRSGLLVTPLLAWACSGSIDLPSNTTPDGGSTTTPPGSTVTYGKVTGRVFSASSGQPLPGVTVTARNGSTVTTDDTGRFTLAKVPVGDRSVITASAAGIADLVRPLVVKEGATAYVELFAASVGARATVDPAAGARVAAPSGAAVTIPAGALVKRDGSAVTGPVEVSVTALNPTSNNEIAGFPGDFAAKRGDGTPVLLETVVPMDITARLGDETLTLAPGQSATITFPVYDPANAPSTVELWSLDPTTGAWTEEGVAVRTLGANGEPVYAATIKHFSWWNVDKPLATKSCVRGVITKDGSPVPYASVRGDGVDYQTKIYGLADESGAFAVDVKLDGQVSVRGEGAAGTSDAVVVRPTTNASVTLDKSRCLDIGSLELKAQAASDCPSGRVRCGDQCVDTSSDRLHCGACGQACTMAGAACIAGSCGCAASETACNGACVRTDRDRNHCGGCNVRCGDGQECVAGACKAFACPAGYKTCGASCVPEAFTCGVPKPPPNSTDGGGTDAATPDATTSPDGGGGGGADAGGPDDDPAPDAGTTPPDASTSTDASTGTPDGGATDPTDPGPIECSGLSQLGAAIATTPYDGQLGAAPLTLEGGAIQDGAYVLTARYALEGTPVEGTLARTLVVRTLEGSRTFLRRDTTWSATMSYTGTLTAVDTTVTLSYGCPSTTPATVLEYHVVDANRFYVRSGSEVEVFERYGSGGSGSADAGPTIDASVPPDGGPSACAAPDVNGPIVADSFEAGSPPTLTMNGAPNGKYVLVQRRVYGEPPDAQPPKRSKSLAIWAGTSVELAMAEVVEGGSYVAQYGTVQFMGGPDNAYVFSVTCPAPANVPIQFQFDSGTQQLWVLVGNVLETYKPADGGTGSGGTAPDGGIAYPDGGTAYPDGSYADAEPNPNSCSGIPQYGKPLDAPPFVGDAPVFTGGFLEDGLYVLTDRRQLPNDGGSPAPVAKTLAVMTSGDQRTFIRRDDTHASSTAYAGTFVLEGTMLSASITCPTTAAFSAPYTAQGSTLYLQDGVVLETWQRIDGGSGGGTVDGGAPMPSPDGGSTEPMDGGAPMPGTDGGTSPPDSTNACTDLPASPMLVSPKAIAASPPAMTGGDLPIGVFYLADRVAYTGGPVDLTPLATTMSLGDAYALRRDSQGYPAETRSGALVKYDSTGKLDLAQSCPSSVPLSLGYTWDAAAQKLFLFDGLFYETYVPAKL